MTEADAVKAIYQRWMTQWPTPSGNIPYVFDDDVVDEVSGGFARVSITLTGDEQHTLGQTGARKYLRTGQVDVKLYGPANQGRGPLDALSAVVRGIYEGARFGATGTEDGVVCYASSAKELRPESSAQFWCVQVTTPFEFFEVR